MGKNIAMAVLLAALVLLCALTGVATEESAERPDIILYTAYRQVGWGDRIQVGCLDERGGLWLLIGHDGKLKWPYQAEQQVEYLKESQDLEKTGEMGSDDLFALKSLIICTQAQEVKPRSAANDAGVEVSYAVRYGEDGTAEPILLGMSGDSCFENTDENAQALYRWVHLLFPQVTCYGAQMGPSGFAPVPVRTFCKLEQVDFQSCRIEAVYNDCETGPHPIEVTKEDLKTLEQIVMNGQVTGKANALMTTGDTTQALFFDKDGTLLGSLEFCQGLLVTGNGMYSLEADGL